jgi:hypothetical protein
LRRWWATSMPGTSSACSEPWMVTLGPGRACRSAG